MDNEKVVEKEIDYEKITSSLDEKVSQKLDGFLDKVKEEVKPKEEPKDDFKWTADDDESESYVTKKDLKEIVTKTLEKSKEISEESAKKTTDSTIQAKEARLTKDRQAVTDFPMLSNGQYYDKEFVEAVSKEMDARIARGRHKDDPDLMYDSAAVVKARSGKWDKTMQEKVLEETRDFNNQQSRFTAKGKGKKGPSGPSESQKELARKMGMDTEKFVERFKRMSN
jgi:hypothetical protein